MEKRYYGRVSKSLSAIIENEDGLRLKVLAVDTAWDSVHILCTIYQRDVITPGGSFIRDGRPVELLISIDLPNEEGRADSVAARCHITYSRRISKEQCMIGMRYIDFKNNSQERLLRFIKTNMVTSQKAPECIEA